MINLTSVLTTAKLAETVLKMTRYLADWLTKRKTSRTKPQAKATTMEGMNQPLTDINHSVDDRSHRDRRV